MTPMKVLELHHHGIRIDPAPEAQEQARQFYTEVLGLETDPGNSKGNTLLSVCTCE
jgi:hypothetical protein